jgi:transketolase
MFSDYARNALRMAALMRIRAIQVFTHDSIGLGEDGPTHQPIEQVASLRLIPNMDVWRPADSVETMVAWIAAVERHNGPTSLVLTRQNAPFFERDAAAIENVRRGGYVLAEADAERPAVILIATGSEVSLAMDAAKALAGQGIAARVVSMPCTNLFDRQDEAYKATVLPAGVKRVAIEAGVTDGWRKYVGQDGGTVGIDTFGESAPPAVLFEHFGFSVANVVNTVKSIL